jgi:AcrR family transcriptional regulator
MSAVSPTRRGSHGDRRAATRRRLLDATIDALVELGYSRTTTLEVQRRAGVSRGALLHHFASRADLLVAAVDHLAAVRIAELHEELLRSASGPFQYADGIDTAWQILCQPSSIAVIELWTASRTDVELADALRRNEPALAAQIFRVFDALIGGGITGHPAYAAFRTTVAEAMIGAAIAQHVRGPAVIAAEIAQWKQLAEALFGSSAS